MIFLSSKLLKNIDAEILCGERYAMGKLARALNYKG